MIDRRRPILSAIANRRMFMGGGMVTPMPQPTYMDLMPQQMGIPREAQGIMASSQPLVDAIAGDANNPAGGDTLSMAQGGIAKFQQGGVQYDPATAVTRAQLSPSENLQRLFPPERAAGLLDQIGIGKGPGELYSDEPSITRRIVGMIPGRVGTALEGTAQVAETFGNVVDSFLGQRFRGQGDILSYLFGEEEEASGRGFGERRGLTEILSRISPELKQQNPDIERDILEIGANLIGKTGSTQEFMETVADQYAQTQEAGYAAAMGDVNRGQTDAVSDEGFSAPQPSGAVIPDDESFNYRDELNKKIGEYRVAMGQGPQAQMEFAQKLSADPNFPQAFKDEVLQSADVGSPIDAGTTLTPQSSRDPRRDPLDDSLAITNEKGELITEDAPETRKDAAGQADQPKTVAPKSPSISDDDDSLAITNEKGELVTEDAPSAKEGPLKDPGSNPFSLEAAIQEFTDAMPKYKRSEENAGYNIIMLGAAIAAGESPNAITNIAKGVQKALPDIIKDEKEAEAYLRSVRMAGAKYALGKRDKLEAEKRLEERTKNTYYLDKDVTITGPDGQSITYNKGWNRLNDGAVNQISTLYKQALTPMSVFVTAQKNAAAAIKAQGSSYEKSTSVDARLNDKFNVKLKVQFPTPAARAAGARPVVLNPSELTNSYFEAVGNNDSLLALANSSAELLGQPDQKVTGFNQIAGKLYDVQKAYLGDNAPNLLKSAAITDRDGATTYATTLADFSDANRYNTQLRFLAIQMAPLLLGESGKTISDGDRRLIAEALGLAERKDGKFTWIQSASISRGELLYKVNQIRSVLRRARKDLDNNFAGIVRDYGGQMPTREAIATGSQGATGRTLNPFILTRTEDKDSQGRPIYDIRRRGIN